MPVEILVPQMGESIVEATIAQWLKKPGDTVAAGETLVELETDKVNVTIEAESAGVLTGVLASEGATVAVGQSIGTIGGAGESVAAAPIPAPAEKPGPAAPVPATNAQNPTPTTPVAASMAAANGVDLSGVAATGPAGKIGKSDVEAKISAPQATVTPVATIPQSSVAPSVAPTPKIQNPAPRPASTRPEERVKMSKRRQTIAANLKHAQNTAAMLTTFNEVDLSRVMELRTRRKADFEKRFGVGLGFMSFFTKASISALKAFPSVNAEVDGDEIILKKYYDIGIAVGLEDGLVVPVVRDADRLSFAEIEKTIKELAGKARDGKLGIADLTGGTFTITNGGVYGSLMSTPILNHPQVGILGMHTIKERPIVVDGAIVIRPMMNLALSYDHRIIDGSTAVRFLVKVKDLLEDPETLLLEG